MGGHGEARFSYQTRRILVSRLTHEGLAEREAAKALGTGPGWDEGETMPPPRQALGLGETAW